VLPVEAGARQAAIRAKQGLAQGAGGASDHLALVKAFNGWSAARRAGQEKGYCSSNFLSSSTMMMVNGMRTQLLGELQVLLTVQHTKHMLVTCTDMTVHVHPVHAVQASLQLQLASNFQSLPDVGIHKISRYFKVHVAVSSAVPVLDKSCVKSAGRAVHLPTLIIAPAICLLTVRPDVHQT